MHEHRAAWDCKVATGLLYNFTYVKMKGPNKQNLKLKTDTAAYAINLKTQKWSPLFQCLFTKTTIIQVEDNTNSMANIRRDN